MTSPKQLPPGLADLAEQEQLTEAQVAKLAAAWNTIRGRRPMTAEEWGPIYRAVKAIWDEERV